MTNTKEFVNVVEDGESSESYSSHDDEEESIGGNVKIKKVASIMNKILQSSNDNIEQTILSKLESTIENKNDNENLKRKQSKSEKQLKKAKWSNTAKSYPDIKLDYEKERKLRIIATQGVVQLFSTIESHKRRVEDKLIDRKTEHQKMKALEEVGKKSFLNLLEKKGTKVISQPLKKEIKEEEKPSKSGWLALAQNFYEETSLSNWDKNDSDEG